MLLLGIEPDSGVYYLQIWSIIGERRKFGPFTVGHYTHTDTDTVGNFQIR
jgi:hypothetical protein